MIIIRELQKSDLWESSRFWDCMEALKPNSRMRFYAASQILEVRRLRGIKTYVARDDSQSGIVGTLSLFIEPKFLSTYSAVAHIEDVAVRQDAQGLGIGKELVKFAIRESEKARCYKIILDCRDEVKPFYRKLGFHEHEQQMRLDI